MEENLFYLFYAGVLIVAIAIALIIGKCVDKVRKVRIEDECKVYAKLITSFKTKRFYYNEINNTKWKKILEEASLEELRHEQRVLKGDLGSTWAMALSYTVSSVLLSKVLPFFVKEWSDVDFISTKLLTNLAEAVFVGTAIWIVNDERKKYKRETYFLGMIENTITEKEKKDCKKSLEDKYEESEKKLQQLEQDEKEQEKRIVMLEKKVETVEGKLYQQKEVKERKNTKAKNIRGIHITFER